MYYLRKEVESSKINAQIYYILKQTHISSITAYLIQHHNRNKLMHLSQNNPS